MNKNIIELFDKLIMMIKYKLDIYPETKDKYRLKAIINTREIINKYPKKITNYKQIENIDGIGKGSIRRIKEILETNNLSEINNFNDNVKYIKYTEELEKIFGIGRKKAYELYFNYGIKSIDELKKKFVFDIVAKNKILLPKQIMVGLKYINNLTVSIPRHDIDEINSYIKQILTSVNIFIIGIICGSYRRKMLTSGDIDLLISSCDVITKKDISKYNYFKIIIDTLINKKFIIDSLFDINKISTSFMGFCRFNNKIMRIDIRYVPMESFYYALLHMTGPKNFNMNIRNIAKTKGFKLNEYGLFKNNEMIIVNSEQDIFNLLDMKYIDPRDR